MPMMMGTQRRLESFFSDLLGRSRESILRFEPQAGTAATKVTVPERLVAHDRVEAALAVRRRRFVLNMGMGGKMGDRGGMMGGGQGSGMTMHAINGRAFDMERLDEQVRLGDVEIWEASGEMMAHPFHIHGVHFEVLSHDGAKPAMRDQGLRDTVLVKEPVELLVRFTQPATKAPFMYHCHILEHEDNGMMGQFSVS